MNDSYYRDLIRKVADNQRRMFNGEDESENDFEDFSHLWEILFDEDPDVTPETFFDAAGLCLYSYFGASQNPAIVFKSMLNRLKTSLTDQTRYDGFKNAFIDFSETDDGSSVYGPVTEIFSEMVRIAIEKSDLRLIIALLDMATNEDLWNNDDEKYADWAVWFSVFLDKDFSEVPVCRESIEALNCLKGKFNDESTIERIAQLDSTLNA